MKSSGAVSPAARATASIAPLTMPRERRREDDASHRDPAAGTERVARLPELVGHELQHLLARPDHDRQHRGRRARAHRRTSSSPRWSPALTQIVATNSPITIDGTPVITSAMNRMTRASRLLPAVLVEVDRGEHAERYRHQRRHAGEDAACPRSPARSRRPGVAVTIGRSLVRNDQLITEMPLHHDVERDEAQRHEREHHRADHPRRSRRRWRCAGAGWSSVRRPRPERRSGGGDDRGRHSPARRSARPVDRSARSR